MQSIEERLVQVQDALDALALRRETYVTVATEGATAAELAERKERFGEACTTFHAALTDLIVAARSVRADTERAVAMVAHQKETSYSPLVSFIDVTKEHRRW